MIREVPIIYIYIPYSALLGPAAPGDSAPEVYAPPITLPANGDSAPVLSSSTFGVSGTEDSQRKQA